MTKPLPEEVLLALYEYERAAIGSGESPLTEEFFQKEHAVRVVIMQALAVAYARGRAEALGAVPEVMRVAILDAITHCDQSADELSKSRLQGYRRLGNELAESATELRAWLATLPLPGEG